MNEKKLRLLFGAVVADGMRGEMSEQNPALPHGYHDVPLLRSECDKRETGHVRAPLTDSLDTLSEHSAILVMVDPVSIENDMLPNALFSGARPEIPDADGTKLGRSSRAELGVAAFSART